MSLTSHHHRLPTFILGCLTAALLATPLAAQVQIDYSNGQTDTTPYDTSTPNDPTTLSILSGTATQSGVLTGSGGVIKTGAGTLILSGINDYTGGTIIKAGTLQVVDGASLSKVNAPIVVADQTGDVARLLISGGTFGFGLGGDTDSYIGNQVGSSGTIDQTGGTWHHGNLNVGYNGTGVLNISGGDSGNPTGNPALSIGVNAGGSGTVNVSGGTMDNQSVYVGHSGTGVLNITGGSFTNDIGYIGTLSGSSGTANVSGGTWSNGSVLYVGAKGTGVLNITDSGTVNATSLLYLAGSAGSSGTLNLGTGGAAGTLNAASIYGGSGTAVVNFNHTGTYTFANSLYDSLSVNQIGSGATRLTAASTYTGTTDVKAGALVVNGSLTGGSAFTVASGASLAGTGSVSLAADQSMFVNGVLSVGDFTSLCNPASVFSVTTSGTGSIVMGAGSAIVVDLFSGAGNGDNTHISGASDQLSLHGNLNATAGGTIYLLNPNAMTSFAIGDQWKVVNLNCGSGSITGTLGVNGDALGLAALGFIGVFDSSTGIVSIVDHRAEFSATTSGLPMANAENQAIIGGMQTATGDVNNHLFNLRAGGGEEADDSISATLDYGVLAGEGDGPEDKNPIAKRVKRSRQWEVFTTVNYGNVRLNSINNQAGVQVDSWASSVGIERHLSRGLTLGFAATFLQSTQTYTGGLGKVDLEGPTLSTYLSFVRRNFWSSLLYSFGDYDMGTFRNPGFGLPTAFGSTRAYTNSVQFNTGYNFRFQNDTLVTGPFVGIDYLHGSVDGYTETGGGLGALAYARQTFESLVTRIGWSTSKKFDTTWASITPQFRVSYERQNVKNNGTSVQSINAPFSAAGGNQSPGQDYMVIGTGVSFQFTPEFNMQLGYQTQIFRNNLEAHFGSVRFGYKF